MFCDRCGAVMNAGYNFCPTCGKPYTSQAGTPPPAASVRPSDRVARHLRTVGILWIAMAALRLLPSLALFGIGHGILRPMVGNIHGFPPFAPGILHGLGTIFLLMAAVTLAVGWGLLERAPWARMFAIVMAFLVVFDMPLGTALGVFTLWVLLPRESEEEYRRLARPV